MVAIKNGKKKKKLSQVKIIDSADTGVPFQPETPFTGTV